MQEYLEFLPPEEKDCDDKGRGERKKEERGMIPYVTSTQMWEGVKIKMFIFEKVSVKGGPVVR